MRPVVRISILLAGVMVAASAATAGPTIDQVRKRGQLVCGVNPGVAGFGSSDERGNWNGFDVDFCRAVAAALFNDPTKVRFVPLNAKDRLSALQNSEIDILSRNTSYTLSREATQGLEFGAITYFDGQGFMVRKKLNLSSALELSNATVCVQQDTTTELNLADFFRAHSMSYEPVIATNTGEAIKSYDSGRCNAFTTDISQLYAERTKLGAPEEHVVLPEVISKEPLGPAVRQGDDQWYNIVKWVHYATVAAEEAEITSKNVDDKMKDPSPNTKRLLGTEGNFGEPMGLTADWAYRIIKHVGNYGEIFDRNLGEGSKLKIKRGVNALWTKNGLQYAPPIR